MLIDVLPSGELDRSAAGLLGAAAGIGTPVALIVTAPGRHEQAAGAAGDLGAARVLIAESDAVASALTAPRWMRSPRRPR